MGAVHAAGVGWSGLQWWWWRWWWCSWIFFCVIFWLSSDLSSLTSSSLLYWSFTWGGLLHTNQQQTLQLYPWIYLFDVNGNVKIQIQNVLNTGNCIETFLSYKEKQTNNSLLINNFPKSDIFLQQSNTFPWEILFYLMFHQSCLVKPERN